MQVVVTFRHMPPSEPLRKHAEEKLLHIQRYFHDLTDAHVALVMERYLYHAEITLHVHGMVVRGEEISTDMYNSIDRAVEKIETQLRRYHNKLITLKSKEGARLRLKYKVIEPSLFESDAANASNAAMAIENTRELETRSMMLDEAVMQMDLMQDDVLVFVNAKTDHINILYRKKNNKYGLIESDISTVVS